MGAIIISKLPTIKQLSEKYQVTPKFMYALLVRVLIIEESKLKYNTYIRGNQYIGVKYKSLKDFCRMSYDLHTEDSINKALATKVKPRHVDAIEEIFSKDLLQSKFLERYASQSQKNIYFAVQKAYSNEINKLKLNAYSNYYVGVVPAEHYDLLHQACLAAKNTAIEKEKAEQLIKEEERLKKEKLEQGIQELKRKFFNYLHEEVNTVERRNTKYVYGRTPNDKLGRSGVGKERKNIPPHGR